MVTIKAVKLHQERLNVLTIIAIKFHQETLKTVGGNVLNSLVHGCIMTKIHKPIKSWKMTMLQYAHLHVLTTKGKK